MVGSSPVSRFHFLDGDPVSELPLKRFRITGKSAAGKRTAEFLGEPPKLKRWKRLFLPGLRQPRDEVGSPPDLFPRLGVG